MLPWLLLLALPRVADGELASLDAHHKAALKEKTGFLVVNSQQVVQ
jgi:hypothetical protein